MIIDFNIPIYIWAVLGAALILCIWSIIDAAMRTRRIVRHKRLCNEYTPTSSAPMPGVSVVIYSQDQADNLSTLLPAIHSQQYDGEIDIVVVNEGASETVSEVVGQLLLKHQNIYLTFTPDGARNLSRKKLALTLGIKAARHEIVILTTASAAIDSDTWLQRMLRHFADESTQVVLGYSAPTFAHDYGMGQRTRCFDYICDNMAWISSAIKGKPYRGSEYNLAYRRELFFKNKGFSRSLNLHNGDDDIFVSEIAHGDNTVVEIADDAMTRCNTYNMRRYLRDERTSRVFTCRHLRKGSRRSMAFDINLSWLSIAASGVAIAAAPTNIVVCGAAALPILATIIMLSVFFGKAVRALHGRPLALTLPWLILTRPIRNIALSVRSRITRQRNYTWKK